MGTTNTKILIADDHAIVRMGLASLPSPSPFANNCSSCNRHAFAAVLTGGFTAAIKSDLV